MNTAVKQQQQEAIMAEAKEKAILLAANYDIDSFKINPKTGQVHLLAKASRRKGAVNATYRNEVAILNAYNMATAAAATTTTESN